MKVWKWDVPADETIRDLGLVTAGAAAVVVGELLWDRRAEIQQSAKGIIRHPADIAEAENVARTYLTQMGIGNITIQGSNYDGKSWTVQARSNGKGPTHTVRIDGKSRTVIGWTQSPE
jgi:hypothetical protein